MNRRILVTPRSLTAGPLTDRPELRPLFDAGWEVVAGPPGRVPDRAELVELVRDIDGWLAGVETVSAEVLAAAGRLRIISRNGIGADAIDQQAAAERGVTVALARGANSRGVAELTFALILSCLRGIPAANEVLHAGGWERALGRELPDVTVGVVGFGAIGRLVGGFASSFGSRVLACDPFAVVDPGTGVDQVSLDDLFFRSDVVSLHSPPGADGVPVVNGVLLDRMPEDGILVNTARSALVDDRAVLAALEAGRLGWYAVDSFDEEPPQLTPLLAHRRTVLTPHLGGFTGASVRRATAQAVGAIINALG